ncbi:MAG: ChaB family protein [Spirulinaceae cyanobacterium]
MSTTTINKTQERTLSAIFQQESQVEQAIRRLLDRGIERDRISVMGRNFESQTRISGFITKKDVILGGLRTGAIFGSLFGSLLSLLTGVGVLFIPFVGSVVAAGPITSLLLGATTGAIAGGVGAGLASALTTLGMPEEKAAIYQTRVQAGEFLLMVDVSAERSGEYQLLLENAGGQEIHIAERSLTRACPGRCESVEELSPEVRNHLSEAAQVRFQERYNAVYDDTESAIRAEEAAWQTIYEEFEEDEQGVWSKQKVSA